MVVSIDWFLEPGAKDSKKYTDSKTGACTERDFQELEEDFLKAKSVIVALVIKVRSIFRLGELLYTCA